MVSGCNNKPTSRIAAIPDYLHEADRELSVSGGRDECARNWRGAYPPGPSCTSRATQHWRRRDPTPTALLMMARTTNHQPAPHNATAENVIRIGIGGESGHVARAPADCARIGSENVEDADATKREHDRLADKLAGKAGFLRERRWSLEAAQREHRENHTRQDAAEVMGRGRGL